MFASLPRFALGTLALLALCSSSLASCPPDAKSKLQRLVSNNTVITDQATEAQSRWSDYDAPTAALYVQVADEKDVATIVQFADQYDYEFLVQNGGNGWATTFHLQGCSILADISSLDGVTFNQDRTQARIQGGVSVKHLVTLAAGNNTRIAAATCNCLGFLGAALGGGQTRVAGLYGLSTDQLIEMNVVLANGTAVTTNADTHPDLYYALRGAGPNFGIVTSALVKAYPQAPGGNLAWQGSLIYNASQIEPVLKAISEFPLEPHTEFDFTFLTSGSPEYNPIISIVPFFIGNASAGRQAFSSFLKLDPINDTTGEVAYTNWNDPGNSFCSKGGYKPSYGATLAHIDVPTWVSVFEEFANFVASNKTALGDSAVVAENYPIQKSSTLGNGTSSYPWRDLGRHVVAIPVYEDPSHNDAANAFASKVRDMWWATAGTERNSSYINFAHGNEALSVIYGDSLHRLQQLKRKLDPKGRFDQWFPISG